MDEKEMAQIGLEFMWERLKESIVAISKRLKSARRRKEDQEAISKIEKELSEVLKNLLTLNPDLAWADQVIQASEGKPVRPAKLQVVRETRDRVATKRASGVAKFVAKKAVSKKPAAKKASVKKASTKKVTKK